MKTFHEWLQEADAKLDTTPMMDNSDSQALALFQDRVAELGWNHPTVKNIYRHQMDVKPHLISKFRQIIVAAQKPKKPWVSDEEMGNAYSKSMAIQQDRAKAQLRRPIG